MTTVSEMLRCALHDGLSAPLSFPPYPPSPSSTPKAAASASRARAR